MQNDALCVLLWPFFQEHQNRGYFITKGSTQYDRRYVTILGHFGMRIRCGGVKHRIQNNGFEGLSTKLL